MTTVILFSILVGALLARPLLRRGRSLNAKAPERAERACAPAYSFVIAGAVACVFCFYSREYAGSVLLTAAFLCWAAAIFAAALQRHPRRAPAQVLAGCLALGILGMEGALALALDGRLPVSTTAAIYSQLDPGRAREGVESGRLPAAVLAAVQPPPSPDNDTPNSKLAILAPPSVFVCKMAPRGDR